jgi:hypothetical protein
MQIRTSADLLHATSPMVEPERTVRRRQTKSLDAAQAYGILVMALLKSDAFSDRSRSAVCTGAIASCAVVIPIAVALPSPEQGHVCLGRRTFRCQWRRDVREHEEAGARTRLIDLRVR